MEVAGEELARATLDASVGPASPLWGAVWALGIGVASLSTSEMLPVSLLTPLARDLQVTEGIAGQAVTAAAIVAVLASVVLAPLVGPQGIFKPAVLASMPLSILTVPVDPRKPRPYEDAVGEDVQEFFDEA